MDMDKLKKELWVKFAAAALSGFISDAGRHDSFWEIDAAAEDVGVIADSMIYEYEKRFGEV
jgi:hypothetical protein